MCLVSVHRDRGVTAFLFFAISRKMGLGFTLGISVCLVLEKDLGLALETEMDSPQENLGWVCLFAHGGDGFGYLHFWVVGDG